MGHNSLRHSRKRGSSSSHSSSSALEDISKIFKDNNNSIKSKCELRSRSNARPLPYTTKNRRPLRRRKMSLYWDVPPAGFENVSPEKYKDMLRHGQALESVAPCARQVLVPILSATITRQARRLYVGGLPFGITEDEMTEFFNDQMHLMALAQAAGNPVLACQINLEKNFAFLEFRSIDETTQAMALDGVNYQGQTLKVRRPHDYQPLPGDNDNIPILNHLPPAPGFISNIIPDSPNKIFIGGLPNFVTEDQAKELLQTFGELRGFNLIKDGKSGLNKGYAFCEYMDPSVTNLAISSLDGMPIGERKISVQRAIFGSRTCAFSVTSTSSGATTIGPNEATEILCLLNMVSVEDLADDDEFNDIMCDIKEECENFGVVRSIEIPRPIDNAIVHGCGKIYIEFDTVWDCQRALCALSGRKFNGRTVITSFYDPKKYRSRDFM